MTEAPDLQIVSSLITPFLQGLPTLKSLNITCNTADDIKNLNRVLPSLPSLQDFIFQYRAHGGDVDPSLLRKMLGQVPCTLRCLGFHFIKGCSSSTHVVYALAHDSFPAFEKLLLFNLSSQDLESRRKLGQCLRTHDVGKNLKTLFLGMAKARRNGWKLIQPILSIDPDAETNESVLPSLRVPDFIKLRRLEWTRHGS